MLASAVPAELKGACTMKVCTKCGWQNEDNEAKCFQCFADLSVEETPADIAKAVVPVENDPPVVEPSASDAEVWTDPDMRPIEHDTPDQQIPVTFEVIEEEETETEESTVSLPSWALIAIGAAFLLIALAIGKAIAGVPENDLAVSVSQILTLY